jgi:hypothetical protein
MLNKYWFVLVHTTPMCFAKLALAHLILPKDRR